ncbi:MAG: hypothetical protein REI95_01785, partial [Oxalicibacterium faecigallinarum]|uniref:hypothetical protein n=1 Tax=Oxalicibacterium faecigallinarum TaxID=573741 RepID=UPI0028067406
CNVGQSIFYNDVFICFGGLFSGIKGELDKTGQIVMVLYVGRLVGTCLQSTKILWKIARSSSV